MRFTTAIRCPDRTHLKKGRGWLTGLAVLLSCASALAGGGPENVALVINGRSWASQWIAHEFQKLRNIPDGNVVVLDTVPSLDDIPVEQFRTTILFPALKALDDRGLSRQIDYLIYSSDFPTGIDVRSDLGKLPVPKVLTPVGSLTGLTYLSRRVLAHDPNYLSLQSNHYFRDLLPLARQKLEPGQVQTFTQAQVALQKKEWATAAEKFAELEQALPHIPTLPYNLACCLARQEKADEALAALARAVTAGWWNVEHLLRDEDLKALRDRDEFRALTEKVRAVPFQFQPSQGFRAMETWNEFGERAPGGERYLLSTQLAVTSGRGNSVSEALASLRRSVSADFTKPAGTIYFPINGDVRSKTRQDLFPRVVEQLKQVGVRAEVLPGVLPQKKDDILGAMVGTAGFQFDASGSKILPGAICEHLTSYGGMMGERAGQTPLTEWIRAGAAGSSGTVTEPFAIQDKFPFPLLHWHYAQGCTLAESFYQAVHGPYQLLIVGDPLCAPWAVPPRVDVAGLTAGQVLGKEAVPLQPKVSAGPAVERFELFVDGRRTADCAAEGTLTLSPESLPEGLHEIRVVAIGKGPIATQGRWLTTVEVRRGGPRLEVARPKSDRLPWHEPLKLAAHLPGATRITLFQHHRVIAAVRGERGDLEIDLAALGPGPVTLQPVGLVLQDDKPVQIWGEPLRLEVVPPPLMPARMLAPAADLKPGLKLKLASGRVEVIADTFGGDWLSKAKVEPGTGFELSGDFEVPADEVYQFQIQAREAGDVTLLVDGQTVRTVTNADWHFIPVPLAAGRHSVEVRGTAGANPRLWIKFGGPGARSLQQDRFRHLTNADAL